MISIKSNYLMFLSVIVLAIFFQSVLIPTIVEANSNHYQTGQYVQISSPDSIKYKKSRYDSIYYEYSDSLKRDDIVVVLSDYIPSDSNSLLIRVYRDSIGTSNSKIPNNATGQILRANVNPVYQITADNINLKSKPSLKSANVIDELNQDIILTIGDMVTLKSSSMKNSWHKVSYHGSIGYLESSVIEKLIKKDVYSQIPVYKPNGTDIIENMIYIAYTLQNTGSVLNTGTSYTDGILSFNCSGFVHWVLKQSGLNNGAYNMGNNAFKSAYELFYDSKFEQKLNLLDPLTGKYNLAANSSAFKEYLCNTLEIGDLLFFKTSSSEYYEQTQISHVAIYLGAGNMIHNATPLGVLIEDVWEYSSQYPLKELKEKNLNNIIGIARLKDTYRSTDIHLESCIDESKVLIEGGVSIDTELSILANTVDLKGAIKVDHKFINASSRFTLTDSRDLLTSDEWISVTNQLTAYTTNFNFGKKNAGHYYLHILIVDDHGLKKEIVSGVIYVDDF